MAPAGEYEPRDSADFVDDLGLGYRSSGSSEDLEQDEYIPRSKSRSQQSSTRYTFSYLLALKDRDAKQFHKILVLTFQKLDQETQRATSAERNLTAAMLRLRSETELRRTIEAEHARTREELGMYKVQLEQAQHEIFRAQEILDAAEVRRRDAEEEAARARSMARKFKEERVINMAMEEGRGEGYEHGWKVGFEEAVGEQRPRRPREIIIEEDYEEEEPSIVMERQRRHRTRSAPSAPSPPQPIISRPSPPPPPRNHVPDVAPFASPASIPVLTTPFRPPSSTRSRTPAAPLFPPRSHTPSARYGSTSAWAQSPPHSDEPSIIRTRPPSAPPVQIPIPIAASSTPSSSPHQYQDPVPIPAPYQPQSPIRHPRSPVPPDNYIPYAERSPDGRERIYLPPPHELISPVSPGPGDAESFVNIPSPERPVQGVELAGPPPAPVPIPSSSRTAPGPYAPPPPPSVRGEVRSRDYAYGSGTGFTSAPISTMPVPMPERLIQVPSNNSRASTHLSEYDLLRPVQVPEPRVRHTRPRATPEPQGLVYSDAYPAIPVPMPRDDPYRRSPSPTPFLHRPSQEPSRRRRTESDATPVPLRQVPVDRSQSRSTVERGYSRPRRGSESLPPSSERPARPMRPRRSSSGVPGITVEPPSPENSPPSPTHTAQTATDRRLLSPDITNRPLSPSLLDLEAILRDPPRRPKSPRHHQSVERPPSRTHTHTPASHARSSSRHRDQPPRPLTPLQELGDIPGFVRTGSMSSHESTQIPPRAPSRSAHGSHRSHTPAQSSSTPSRSHRDHHTQRHSPTYEAAPVPENVHYPDSPLRGMSDLAGEIPVPPPHSNVSHGRKKQAVPVPEQTSSEATTASTSQTVQTETTSGTARQNIPGNGSLPFPGKLMWRRFTSS